MKNELVLSYPVKVTEVFGIFFLKYHELVGLKYFKIFASIEVIN